MNLTLTQRWFAFHLLLNYAISSHLPGNERPVLRRGLLEASRVHHGLRLTKRTDPAILGEIGKVVPGSGSTMQTEEQALHDLKDTSGFESKGQKGPSELKAPYVTQEERSDARDKPMERETNEDHRKAQAETGELQTHQAGESDHQKFGENFGGGGGSHSNGGESPKGDMEDELERHGRVLNLESFEKSQGNRFWRRVKSVWSPIKKAISRTWNCLLSIVSKRKARSPPPGKWTRQFFFKDAPLHPWETRYQKLARKANNGDFQEFRPRQNQAKPFTIFP